MMAVRGGVYSSIMAPFYRLFRPRTDIPTIRPSRIHPLYERYYDVFKLWERFPTSFSFPSSQSRFVLPTNAVCIVERLGKYLKTLGPGEHRITPFIDRVAHVYSLEELDHHVNTLRATTKDFHNIVMRFILRSKVVNPLLAYCKISCPFDATMLHAELNLDLEIGKVTQHSLLTDRGVFIDNVLNSVNATTTSWGVKCVGLEIKDITVSRDCA